MLTDEIGGVEAAREALARERLEELQALARTYRNWSVKELAHALGRQPGRLVPDSGMPKIDLVVGLAKALDWPVEAVVDHLMKPTTDRKPAVQQDRATDYAQLYNESLQKRLERDYAEAIRLAVRARAIADTPTRRAAAFYIESFAHEASGSYVEAVRCLREAVRIDGVALNWRLLCDAHLASVLFMQGFTTQSIGVASSVIEYADSVASEDDVLELARGVAHWAKGHSLRTSIPLANFEAWQNLAQISRDHFLRAEESASRLATRPGFETKNLTFATSIDVIALEPAAIFDEGARERAVRTLVEVIREGGTSQPGVSERKAWASVALANTAKRFLTDPMQLRGVLELASSALRAHAVATNNWYFAHRHLQLDAERRRALVDNGCASRALDATEARLVAGVLGQIPAARSDSVSYFELYAVQEGGRS